ncbi:hypothetical protein MC885_019754, partial [Smutsia gigantea]
VSFLFQYTKVYKNLKELSQNGENFCKQVTSILQQRANLEMNYAKGLQKLAIKLSKALQNTKKNCLVSVWAWVSEGMKSAADLHQKLSKAIELEAIKPTHQVLSVHEKKRKSAKKKLMVSTKKHEALFHLVESSKQTVTKRENQKLLNKLEKSAENLAKEDENYYQKNMAGCSTRVKWEKTLENCYQSILELEKERIQLLYNNLNQYTQHISVFGQTLTTVSRKEFFSLSGVLVGTGRNRICISLALLSLALQCHAQIHCAVGSLDVERDVQAIMEDAALSPTGNKSDFLLTDYFEEDPSNAMTKERQESSIKSKLVRLQGDIEKASRDQEDLERMLKAYSSHASCSDAESQKITATLMDEHFLCISACELNVYFSRPLPFWKLSWYLLTHPVVPPCLEIYSHGQMMYPQTNLKIDLLQANAYKLSSVLAELEKRPQPSHSCSNAIFTWKDKQQTHSYVKISRPFLMKRLENVVSRSSSGGQGIPRSSCAASGVAQLSRGLCKALYSFQARQDDELNLEKGDIVTIHQKKDEGWWFGSLKGKKGHFPAAYVEELPSNAGNTATQA